MQNGKYYVYMFLDERNNVIYVGRTTELNKRMSGHKHLSDECYRSIKTRLYAELESYADMAIYELYYINKIKPKYNTSQKKDEPVKLELEELKWKKYKSNDHIKLKITKDFGEKTKPYNYRVFCSYCYPNKSGHESEFCSFEYKGQKYENICQDCFDDITAEPLVVKESHFVTVSVYKGKGFKKKKVLTQECDVDDAIKSYNLIGFKRDELIDFSKRGREIKVCIN